MLKYQMVSIVAVVCVTWGVARAIPPPWSIEEWKSDADLILIARTMKVEPANGVPGANNRIGIEPVEVLKGKTATTQPKAGEEKDPTLHVLFPKPPPPARGPIRIHQAGALGRPNPREGEFALIFLKKGRQARHFTIALGSFGYIALRTGTKPQKEAVEKRIRMHREWCARIKKEKIRTVMDAYYARTTAFIERIATLRGEVVRKPPPKTGLSPNGDDREYYVLDVGGETLPAGRRSAVEGVILQPSQIVPAETFEKHKTRRVVVEGVFVAGKPHKAPADGARKRPGVKKPVLRGSGFRAYAIRPAARKPAKKK